MPRLDDPTLRALAGTLPAWRHDAARGGTLAREFRFADFRQAFAFMTELALVSEKLDHHPEWSNVYDRVSVTLTTHDASGVTEKDVAWARAADAAYARAATR